MVSWKLTNRFDTLNHLFSNKIDTDYIVETYICICGHHECIIKDPYQVLGYVCSECQNDIFYDANLAWNSLELFLHQYQNIKLDCIYKTSVTKEKISASYLVYIPYKVNFLQKKILYAKKEIYTLSLMINGDIEETYCTIYNRDIFRHLTFLLEDILNSDRHHFDIPTDKNQKTTLKMGEFFLKNRHLKSVAFYYWKDLSLFHSDINITQALQIISNNRKEKSVKRALYHNHLRQITNRNKFDYRFIQVFTKKIKDPNLLVKFLQLDIYCYDLGSEDFIMDLINDFIDFLQIHYSEKQILKLFEELNDRDNEEIFYDTLYEFSYCKHLLGQSFKKPKCKLRKLYDLFVKTQVR